MRKSKVMLHWRRIANEPIPESKVMPHMTNEPIRDSKVKPYCRPIANEPITDTKIMLLMLLDVTDVTLE